MILYSVCNQPSRLTRRLTGLANLGRLIKKMGQDNLYSENSDNIEFLDETLFKVMLTFPKNIARGEYLVEIYLISQEYEKMVKCPFKFVNG